MTVRPRSREEILEIDDVLRDWRQGDIALEADLFVEMHAGTKPGSGPDVITTDVRGIVVLTQTCDIVRTCVERQWVEVAPLVAIPDAALMASIERLARPNYALVPTLRSDRLVADLDRSMTVEKALLASWRRTPGWHTDEEERRFREALARKRSRPAFDDDFIGAIRPLSTRLKKSHGKDSPAGRATDTLSEIRVQPSPSWSNPDVEVFVWFIRDPSEDDSGIDWVAHVETWLGLIGRKGRFQHFEGVATTLEDMTARQYVDSDRLDLDQLSRSGEPEPG